MAVIVEYKNVKTLLIKGSPEKMMSICKKEYQPSNFKDICNSYCNKGYRLLGFGSKVVEDHQNIDIQDIKL